METHDDSLMQAKARIKKGVSQSSVLVLQSADTPNFGRHGNKSGVAVWSTFGEPRGGFRSGLGPRGYSSRNGHVHGWDGSESALRVYTARWESRSYLQASGVQVHA